MIHAFVYILIGVVVANLMQPQITWIAERLSQRKWLQTVIKTFFDAFIGLTWVIGAPALLALKYYLMRKDDGTN